ncbi:hypothetical protein ES702_03227 [subsurface metagenome]
MKIHFILSPPIKKPRLEELSEGRMPPLGILYLAAYLREKINNLQVKVTDGTVEGFEKTYQEVKKFSPDILCISYYTLMALGAHKFINLMKKDKGTLFIITGGPHATALPEEPLEKSNVDVVVIGEGEVTLYELVNLFIQGKHQNVESLAKVDGIAYRDSGQIRFTKTRKHIENLDTIPFPARDLIDSNNYKGWYINKEKKEGAVFSARGCPYNCTFCSNAVWKKCKPYVRTRSPKNIVDEIEMLYKDYGVREIYDCLDEFNTDVKHALAVCEEIKNRKLDIEWKCSMRATPLREELVKAMSESGCWYVMIGIESGNEETLKGINKHITLAQVEEACRLFKKYNLKVQGLFMLYNVWEESGQLKYENTDMVKKTFKYVSTLVDKRLLDYIGWSITVPYPGSQLYNIAQKHNLIKDEYKENWDYWLSKDSYVMQLPGITSTTQIRMKTMGSILRARLLLRTRNFRLKDVSWMVGKALRIVLNELKIIFEFRES